MNDQTDAMAKMTESPELQALERRLTRDAERIVVPSDEERVARVMREIDAQTPANGRQHSARLWWAAPALAAALAIIATPIVMVALRPPAPVTPAHTPQTATVKTLFDAIEQWRLPELPEEPRQDWAQIMQLATPEGLESQTKALLQEGRQWAQHFAQAIPASLRTYEPPDAAPALEEPAARTGALMNQAALRGA